MKTTDWTDHGRPKEHANPHDHIARINPSGGTLKRDDATPLEIIME